MSMTLTSDTRPPLGRLVVNLGGISAITRGGGRIFRVGRQFLAIFHTRNGKVFATEPSCPRKGGSLIEGLIESDKVRCPLHGPVLDLSDGNTLNAGDCRVLKTYPVVLDEAGDILVGIEELLAVR